MHPSALVAAAKRFAPKRAASGFEFMDQLSPPQRGPNGCQSRFVALQCGRRAGKTDLLARRCAKSMAQWAGHNEWTGYITLTKGMSRRNLTGPFNDLIAAHGLPIRGPFEVDGQLTYQHDNGHRLLLGGVDDLRKAERWRGNKWREVYLDEAGSMPDPVLRYTVRTILRPALSDTRGLLWVSGSPGILEKGFFHDITTGKNPKVPQWPTFHWTCLDNPFHPYGQPGGRALLEAEEMTPDGIKADDPLWIREWLGLWCSDPSAIIYPYDDDRNVIDALPAVSSTLDWRWTLGVDIGWDDSTAFVLTCALPGTATMYIVRTWGTPGMTPLDIAMEIRECRDSMLAQGFRAPLVCFDMGGLGKMIAMELQNVHGLSIYPADKWDKAGSIRLFRGGIATGRIKLLRDGTEPLRDEARALPWDDKRHEHHPKYPDHFCDASLYARRGHWPSEVAETPPEEPKTHEERVNENASRYKQHLERIAELRSQMRHAAADEQRDIRETIRELEASWRNSAAA